jgi:hypothetical protein
MILTVEVRKWLGGRGVTADAVHGAKGRSPVKASGAVSAHILLFYSWLA